MTQNISPDGTAPPGTPLRTYQERTTGSPAPLEIILRGYQSDVLDAMRQSVKAGHRRILAVLPTGGGKTVIFCHLAGSFRSRGKRCIIIVHRAELLAQTCATLTRFGIPHGVIAPGVEPSPDELVQVAMIQTLARRVSTLTPPDWLILDECHHAVSATYLKVLDSFPDARILGFTATPERLDGRGLGDVFDAKVEGPAVSWLQDHGHLVNAKYYTPPVTVDLSDVSVSCGDYVRSELSEAMSAPDILGDCVRHYQKLSPGLRAIAFCVDVRHARLVADRFTAAGIPADSIDGTLNPDDRKRTLAEFAAGKITVLTSCELIGEGLDIPAVSTVILLRKTQSLSLHLQQIGRALRPHPGKDHATVIDHTGNVLMHGCAEDPREWSLKGRVKKKTAVEAGWIQCGQCYAMYKRAAVCPECGFTRPATEPKEHVEAEDAELVEFSAPAKLAWSELREEIRRAKRPQDLIPLARRQNYRIGWCFKIFDEIHGGRRAA